MQVLARNIKKSWQYYLTIVLSLSVTLATLFSVFSVVDTVYLKSLPYQDEQGLFWACFVRSRRAFFESLGSLSGSVAQRQRATVCKCLMLVGTF